MRGRVDETKEKTLLFGDSGFDIFSNSVDIHITYENSKLKFCNSCNH